MCSHAPRPRSTSSLYASCGDRDSKHDCTPAWVMHDCMDTAQLHGCCMTAQSLTLHALRLPLTSSSPSDSLNLGWFPMTAAAHPVQQDATLWQARGSRDRAHESPQCFLWLSTDLWKVTWIVSYRCSEQLKTVNMTLIAATDIGGRDRASRAAVLCRLQGPADA